jgi:addiction module HigA family antidote
MSVSRSNRLPATHPGIVFKQRILDRHNVKITDAAKKMGINRSHLNNFTNGKVSVTAPLAMRLEKATGITSGFWMNLQKTYDLYINRDLEINCQPLYSLKSA